MNSAKEFELDIAIHLFRLKLIGARHLDTFLLMHQLSMLSALRICAG